MPSYRTILVANGPNLGSLGERQPEIYGTLSLDDLPGLLRGLLGDRFEGLALELAQTNSEGGLIDRLELARQQKVDGLVLNAGAYTHTSLALADCLAWIGLPCVEVHLSNVWARPDPIRWTSLIAPHCLGVIAGFGLRSYALAVAALVEYLDEKTSND
jgi:3-dehydroquinate dehydratase-2